MSIYSEGNKELQQHFNEGPLAERMEQLIVHHELNDGDLAFIQSRDMFFISTVGADGMPTVSYKGGAKGFVKVIDNVTLAFPGYDGNGMYLTAGNIEAYGKVGLLFIDMQSPQRLRLHGHAETIVDDPLLEEYPEAKYIVRIHIENLFINCGRYIHEYEKNKESASVPKAGVVTPEPDWKDLEGPGSL